MRSSFQEFLFASAAHQVAARNATALYLLEKSTEFAEGFEKWSDSLSPDQAEVAGVLFAKAFTEGFRPGMSLTVEGAILQAEAGVNGVFYLRTDAADAMTRQDARNVAQGPDVAAERAARAEAARLAREQREADQKAADEARKVQDNDLLTPKTVASIPTAELDIDGRARNAYIKLGLTTVGDIEAYAKTQPLESVHGVGESMARETSEAIEALHKEHSPVV